MAPAGDWESMHAALKAGADSVYFGVKGLNMRSARAFETDELAQIVKVCGKVNTYLALNVLLYDEDMEQMRQICDCAKEAGITAVIVADVAAIEYARSIGLRVHISTQANIGNIEAVRYYSRYADAVVLARELTLSQIRKICTAVRQEEIKGPSGDYVKIEVFVHGAMCVSIAGKCYMSLAVYNRSANRGQCLQNCRRAYIVKDEETGDELKIENKYVMSPKDMCTIEILDKIIDTGVSILKIEGRGRKADYVHTTVSVYKEAVQAVLEGNYCQEKSAVWKSQLREVFNRGFWTGYYLGEEGWSGAYGSKATVVKKQVGKCLNYYQDKGVGLFFIEADELNVGDRIAVIGPTTGYMEKEINSMRINNKEVDVVCKGDEVCLLIDKVRKNDVLYVLKKRENGICSS